MSIDDELYTRNLRHDLDLALDAVAPSVPPTSAIKHAGKSIRIRRRVTVAVSLAVAIAVAAAAPGLARGLRPSPPISKSPPKVSIGVITPQSPPGLIAKGTINGVPWQVRLSQLAGTGICVGTAQDQGAGCGTPGTVTKGEPAVLDGFTVGRHDFVLYGSVGRRVTRLAFTLADGSVLTTRPVPYAGKRWLGLQLPKSLTIAQIAAYSSHGLLATAVPFTPPSRFPVVQDWQRPGQPVPAVFAKTVGSGTLGGRPWSITIHAGPWGRCAVVRTPGGLNDGDCWSGTRTSGGIVQEDSHGQPGWWIGSASPQVSYLKILLAGGHVIRVPVVQVGHERLYGFVLGAGSRILRWSSYDHGGQRLDGRDGPPGP